MKVIFCSSTDRGVDLAKWLRKQSCEIVLEVTDDRKIENFPEYDLGLGFLYTHRIPLEEIRSDRKWVNFHPGPLPDMRGRNLAYHAILENRKEFGAAIHYMDAQYDSGDLIETVRFEIKGADTAGDLVERSHLALEELFYKYIPLLLSADVRGTKQAGGAYYMKEAINEFIQLTADQERRARALTVSPKFFPKMVVGGKAHQLRPDSMH